MTTMKIILFFFASLFCISTCLAQAIDLEPAASPPLFQDADVGAITLGDIDNDGDLDFLATGKGGPVLTTLYTNDGSGNFTELIGDPFVDVFGGSVGFEDLNNNGFLDLIITGSTNGGTPTVNLYLNNETGNFTRVASTPFPASNGGDLAFSDVDLDGDQDVVITGINASNLPFSTLYLNDGSASFSEATGVNFEAVKNSAVEFIDIDNDNDEDLIIAGENSSGNYSTKLYANDGAGNFSLISGTPFVGCTKGDISVGDSDNDGDLDILINGATTSGSSISSLYINNGSGAFSLVAGTPFVGTQVGTIDFADFDNDGDADVLVIGAGSPFVVANIYENQGSNTFVLADELVPAYLASSTIGDLNGDNLLDVVIAGTSFTSPIRGTKLYLAVDFVMPVELLSFTAKAHSEKSVILDWTTASEINSSHFSVERSKDGVLFEEIASVNASGNSGRNVSYQQLDNYPLLGRSYYRLKLVDQDNSFSLSTTQTVNLSSTTDEITIYPNPLLSSASLYLTGISENEVDFSLYDATGRLIIKQTILPVEANSPSHINIPFLGGGLYHYSVSHLGKLLKSDRLLISSRPN